MTRTLALFAAALLAACAQGPRKPAASPPEEIVAERAKARWEHLMQGRPEQAWEYIAPGSRALLDRQSYLAQKRNAPVTYTGVELLSTQCEAEVCTVELKVHTQAPLPFAGMVPAYSLLRERWVLSEGSWYFVPDL
jgi:hypothetical protein